MPTARRIRAARFGAGVLMLLLLAGPGLAQNKREIIQATAHGQGNQLGMTIGVTITLESYSTAEDVKALLDASGKGGNTGLLNALVALPARGHFTFSGVAEYEVIYAREFPNPSGRKIRLVAKRPVSFGETRGDQTFKAYTFSALEFDLSPERARSTGTYLPDCEFSVSREKGLEIEAFRNPWRLDGISEQRSR